MKKIITLTVALLSTTQGMEEKTATEANATEKASLSSFKDTWQKFQEFKTADEFTKDYLKPQIIMNLNNLMASGKLQDKEKDEAITIAEGIGVMTLKVRLQAYNKTQLFQEMMSKVIKEFLNGATTANIKAALLINKEFNLALLTAPVSLDLEPFKDQITSNVLVQIAQTFPNIIKLSLRQCGKIEDFPSWQLEGLKNLKYLDLSGSHTQQPEPYGSQPKALSYTSGLNILLGLLKDLEYLDLSNLYDLNFTKLTNLKELEKLKHLNLSGAKELSGFKLRDVLTNLKDLEYLNLSRSDIIDSDLELVVDGLTKLKNFKHLVLSQKKGRDSYYDETEQKRRWVTENADWHRQNYPGITPQALANLKTSLPNVEIEVISP